MAHHWKALRGGKSVDFQHFLFYMFLGFQFRTEGLIDRHFLIHDNRFFFLHTSRKSTNYILQCLTVFRFMLAQPSC